MTDEEFDAFAQAASAELEAKQDALIKEYGIGSYPRWLFDQETEKLQFFDEKDRPVLEADVLQIGSYSPKSNSWMWGWANSTVLLGLRQKAERIKELEGLTGVGLFGAEHAFQVDDEAMAWDLTAFTVKHLGLIGCYRAPSSSKDGPQTFLGIVRIKKVSNTATAK